MKITNEEDNLIEIKDSTILYTIGVFFVTLVVLVDFGFLAAIFTIGLFVLIAALITFVNESC